MRCPDIGACPIEDGDMCLPEYRGACPVCGKCLAGVKVVVEDKHGKRCAGCDPRVAKGL